MWNPQSAEKIISTLKDAEPVLATRGKNKGTHRQYGYRFTIRGPMERHLMIERRPLADGVAVYVNRISVSGKPFAENSIDGVVVLNSYAKGSVGRTGDLGLSSAAGSLPTLKPNGHDVLRVRVRDSRAFRDLLEWYAGAAPMSTPVLSGAEARWVEEANAAGIDESPIDSIDPVMEDKLERENSSYQEDPRKRTAIEQYAIERAREYYVSRGFHVAERGKPYDLECSCGVLKVHVEVKGTATEGDAVILTRNEVIDARDGRWRSDLFIVHDVQLRLEGSEWIVSGGVDRRYEGWAPAEEDLQPLQYKYRVPPQLK